MRLGRADCVEALADLCGSVSVPDGFNLTPLQYGLLLLYKDRFNKTVQVCSGEGVEGSKRGWNVCLRWDREWVGAQRGVG